MNGLGLSYIFINGVPISKTNLSLIKQRIFDTCLQTQNAQISESQKLDFFQDVYKMGQRPPYVDLLKNRDDRATICKIRISAHPLMIERGRYLNIPSKERYCPLCKLNIIEDEKHFFLGCKTFDIQRNIFYGKIENLLGNTIKVKDIHDISRYLLNNNSYPILRLTSSFISNCLDIRSKM